MPKLILVPLDSKSTKKAKKKTSWITKIKIILGIFFILASLFLTANHYLFQWFSLGIENEIGLLMNLAAFFSVGFLLLISCLTTNITIITGTTSLVFLFLLTLIISFVGSDINTISLILMAITLTGASFLQNKKIKNNCSDAQKVGERIIEKPTILFLIVAVVADIIFLILHFTKILILDLPNVLALVIMTAFALSPLIYKIYQKRKSIISSNR